MKLCRSKANKMALSNFHNPSQPRAAGLLRQSFSKASIASGDALPLILRGGDYWKTVVIIILTLLLSNSLFASENFNFYDLKRIPILDQGRVKPFDTFARESVQTITGSLSFEGKDPTETILVWLAEPEKYVKEPVLLSDYQPLNQQFHLNTVKGRISSSDLLDNAEVKGFLKTIFSKQQQGETLNSNEKKVLELYQRLELFHKILSGSALVFFPQSNSEKWSGVDQLTDENLANQFKNIIENFSDKKTSEFETSVKSFKQALFQFGVQNKIYPTEIKMNREVWFNQIRPFQKAWIFFLTTFVFLLFSFGIRNKKTSSFFYYLSVLFALMGVGISIYGFVVRGLIAGRPPVTNMYESVIWVSFGSVMFALIFEAIYRSRYFLLSASACATIGLLLADNLPQVLNPSINPLVPVLRSNFWLTIHVLTITLSYAAFAIAWAIGNIAIGCYAFRVIGKGPGKDLSFFLYRALQVGVVLLAAGTILGGVWANYSWGRFWGWDPKEVWALIALLGYLAILHGRFSGWMKDFGLAVWSVLAFLLVIMAWYGVNFVLGVGLHSYGFSSGGFTSVLIFVGLQFAWVLFATVRCRKA